MEEISFTYEFDLPELHSYEAVFQQILAITKQQLKITQDLMLSVNFIDEEKSLNLNQTYRGKDYAGDVLSFPIDDPMGIYDQLDFKEIGDIFITYSIAQKKQKNTITQFTMKWLDYLLMAYCTF
ncbi:metalloprotease [Spiroplasma clarkii]|uniref:rRNA maturation RNase YbeY n=1 Tax=Spiroplasma clarkii TaxID=2139 RepID=UPI000B5543E5|nr:rRNA maturation RNase YbeY [Spiroplasma clarkii]ARU91449.1 metalloprotease [Spiroplasma clarkii]